MLRTLISALVLSSAMVGVAAAEEVRVTLTGVEARGGQILASLQTESQFLQQAATYGQVVTPVRAGEVVIVFQDVAPGEYALAAFHDQNSDGAMQMQPSGAPAEGYALSNAGALRGPPTFAVARFTVAADVALTEPMTYLYVPPAQ